MPNEISLKKRTVEEANALIISIKGLGLSQKQIAAQINASQSSISKLKSKDFLSGLSLDSRNELLQKLRTLESELQSGKVPCEKFEIDSNKELVKVPLETRNQSNFHINPSKSVPEFYAKKIGKKENIKSSILGATLAGILSCFVTIIGKDYMGYANLDLSKLHQIIPGMLFFFILLGCVLGLISGFYSWQIVVNGKRRWFYIMIVGIISFCVTIIFRGLKSRDSYLMAPIVSGEKGVGFLGEPNFELLATAISVSVCMILLILFLTTKKTYSHTDLLFFSLFTSVISTVIFSLIYQLYKFLTVDYIVEGKPPWEVSTAFFKHSFSHPERNIWVWFIAFCFSYFISNFIRLKAHQKTRTKL